MSALLWLAWAGAALAGIALIMTLLNLLLWPRAARAGQGTRPATSVLVPARDEEATLGALLDSVVTQLGPQDEVIVCDDGSRDGTAAIVAEHAERDGRVRLIRGRGLPAGWVGKPHACAQLGEAAQGEWLVFLDADVVLAPDALDGLWALAQSYRAEALTAVPRQEMGSAAERLVMPLLVATYTSWLLLPLIWWTHDPRLLAANGQIFAFRREAYEAIGGFATARADVVDDMAMGRALKRARRRVLFVDGHRLARCRMYDSGPALWAGFSKNLYEGIGGSPLALAVVLALLGSAWVLPWALAPVALGAALLGEGVGASLAMGTALPAEAAGAGAAALLVPALLGVGAGLAMRLALALRFGHPLTSVMGHPLATLALLGIAINSARWTRSNRIRWAGRTYARKAAR